MQKIGIITFFHNTTNYGGMLQAFALARVINQNGFQAEQIRYDSSDDYFIIRRIVNEIKKFQYKLLHYKECLKDRKIRKNVLKKREAFARFASEYVPSSKEVYNDKTILKTISQYNVFIAGSDQIWSGASKVYFLGFVPHGITKISYAASISREQLSEKQKNRIDEYLKSFQAISVREEKAQQLLSEIGVSSVVVLDPTLLLGKQDWDELSSKKLIVEKYVFCYFLDLNEKQIEVVTDYAKKKNYKIAYIPYMNNHYSDREASFGDYQFTSASPNEFISLIKHAECIFTDSYHATVFSCIYGKDFIVFKRISKYGNMSSRFSGLLCFLELSSHYLENPCEIKDEMVRNNIDINTNKAFIEYKEYCYNFLFSNLNKQ